MKMRSRVSPDLINMVFVTQRSKSRASKQLPKNQSSLDAPVQQSRQDQSVEGGLKLPRTKTSIPLQKSNKEFIGVWFSSGEYEG